MTAHVESQAVTWLEASRPREQVVVTNGRLAVHCPRCGEARTLDLRRVDVRTDGTVLSVDVEAEGVHLCPA